MASSETIVSTIVLLVYQVDLSVNKVNYAIQWIVIGHHQSHLATKTMIALLIFLTVLTLRCAHDEYRSNRKARIHLSGDEQIPG